MEKTSSGSGVSYTNPQGENSFKKLWNFITSANHRKLLGLFILVVLFGAILLTISLSQQRQDIRQRAAQSNNIATRTSATVTHKPSQKDQIYNVPLVFSEKTLSEFSINGQKYTPASGATSTPISNYHNKISIAANGTVTITHDMSNYQYWQVLTPDFLRNQNGEVRLTLEGEPVIERTFLNPPYPSFASLQIELLDPGNPQNDHKVLAHISNMDIWNIGRTAPKTFTVPQGKSIAVYIRAINAQVFFTRLKLFRSDSSSGVNIWEAQREEESPWQSGIFHNEAYDVDTGNAKDSNGVPTGRPYLNSGTVRIIDDPTKTQAVACVDVNTATTYKVTGTLTSSPILQSPYPTFAGISIDEVSDDNCNTYAGRSYTFNTTTGTSEEFKPQSRKIGIFLRAWNRQASFSYPNIKLEEVAKTYMLNGSVSNVQQITPGDPNPTDLYFLPKVAKIVADKRNASTGQNEGSDYISYSGSSKNLPIPLTIRKGQELLIIERVINASANFAPSLTFNGTAVDLSPLPSSLSDFPYTQTQDVEEFTAPINTTYTITGGTANKVPDIPGEASIARIQVDVWNANKTQHLRSAIYPSNSPSVTANAGEKVLFIKRAINSTATFSNLGLTYNIPPTAAPTSVPPTADCRLNNPPATVPVGQPVTFNATFTSTPNTTYGEIDVFTSNGTGSTPISWGNSYGSFSGNAQFINSGSKTNGSLTWTPTVAGTYNVACRAHNNTNYECRAPGIGWTPTGSAIKGACSNGSSSGITVLAAPAAPTATLTPTPAFSGTLSANPTSCTVNSTTGTCSVTVTAWANDSWTLNYSNDGGANKSFLTNGLANETKPIPQNLTQGTKTFYLHKSGSSTPARTLSVTANPPTATLTPTPAPPTITSCTANGSTSPITATEGQNVTYAMTVNPGGYAGNITYNWEPAPSALGYSQTGLLTQPTLSGSFIPGSAGNNKVFTAVVRYANQAVRQACTSVNVNSAPTTATLNITPQSCTVATANGQCTFSFQVTNITGQWWLFRNGNYDNWGGSGAATFQRNAGVGTTQFGIRSSFTSTTDITNQSVTVSNPPTATTTSTPTLHAADVDRNGCVGVFDFNSWIFSFKNNGQLIAPTHRPDINGVNGVDLLDFNEWFRAMTASSGVTKCQPGQG